MKLVIRLALALYISTALSGLLAGEPDGKVPAVESAPPQRILADARLMLSDFKVTRYSHKTLIDRERGVCEVDCSGFIVAILKQAAPDHLRLIPTRHKRPLAEDFYRAFAAAPPDRPRGWLRVVRVKDIEPGDVIAWIKLERQPGDSTGHVVLVEEKPAADSSHQFRVRVLDSTLHGHAHDSRPEGTSGIGRGTIWLEVDGDGRPTGFRWKSRHGMLHDVPIAVARAVALGQPRPE